MEKRQFSVDIYMYNVISELVPHWCLKIMSIMMWVLSLYSFISIAAEWLVNTFLAGTAIIAVNKSAWHVIYEKQSQLDFLVLSFRWLEDELHDKTVACKAMPDFKVATSVTKVPMSTVAWPGLPDCSFHLAESTGNCPPHRDGSTWTRSQTNSLQIFGEIK